MTLSYGGIGRVLRQALAVLAVGSVSCTAPQPSHPSPISEATAVVFDGKTLPRVSGDSSGGAQIAEYLPNGETPETWKTQAAIIRMSGINDPKLWALSIMRSLRQANPRVQDALTDLPRSKDVLLDYVTWPPNGSFVEFRVIRISRLGRNALLIQHYGRRAYGRDIETFLRSLPSERQRLVSAMAHKGLKRLGGGKK